MPSALTDPATSCGLLSSPKRPEVAAVVQVSRWAQRCCVGDFSQEEAPKPNGVPKVSGPWKRGPLPYTGAA